MKVLVYSFRTFPWIEDLKKQFRDVFIFNKLNQDFKAFIEQIENLKLDLIIGLAKGNSTKIEIKTINRFNKNKLISKTGPDFFYLIVPEIIPFKRNLIPTDSFCNWTMYKYISQNDLHSNLSFIHISGSDLPKLSLLKEN